jgi:hypothetical protein
MTTYIRQAMNLSVDIDGPDGSTQHFDLPAGDSGWAIVLHYPGGLNCALDFDARETRPITPSEYTVLKKTARILEVDYTKLTAASEQP